MTRSRRVTNGIVMKMEKLARSERKINENVLSYYERRRHQSISKIIWNY
jgi:hypothetical protein